jgi:hypothetical protein
MMTVVGILEIMMDANLVVHGFCLVVIFKLLVMIMIAGVLVVVVVLVCN